MEEQLVEGVVLMTIYRRGWTVYGDSSDGISYKVSKHYGIVKVIGVWAPCKYWAWTLAGISNGVETRYC